MIQFNLRKGQVDTEILNELRGRVSGETQQEVREFVNFPKVPEIWKGYNWNFPGHEVLLADDQYAIIAKHFRTENAKKEASNRTDYFIAGINDEGRYFVHPLQGLNITENMSIEDIVNWVNRTDQGYVYRVQGDLVCQFVVESFSNTQWNNGRNAEDGGQLSWHGVLLQINPTRWASPGVSREMILGNHRISTNGEMLSAWHDEPALIVRAATELVFQHPQHGVKVLQLPKNHFAAIAGQRGRASYRTFD